MRLPLADRVRLSLLPAAWEREGRVGRADEYFLEIRSHTDGSRRLRTTDTVHWEEAIKYAAMFRGVPWDLAEKRWRRIFPRTPE